MGLDECLYLYTETEWENFTNSYLAGLPDDDKESHDLKLFFNSNMKVCDIDRQGRINIPRAYIDYAHIERDMLNVGFVEKIEIWGKEVFDAKMGSEEMNPRNLLRKIRENKARS
jgi:MraZ protein